SAGDNSFSLLAANPLEVVAVDVNPIQLHLCELKKAAFEFLTYEDFLALLGFTESTQRLALYDKLKASLPETTKIWWEANKEIIEQGIILQGKFEKYFAFFRRRFLPLIHNQKRIDALFAPKTEAAQIDFYNKEWNNWRWRLFFNIFFSRFVMGRYGRDPEFMNEVKVKVSEYIFGKAENHLMQVAAQKNLYLKHILTGHFGTLLPHYARKENFDTIQQNIKRIHFICGYAEEAPGVFQAFNLSNIFEYMPQAIATETATKLAEKASEGARFGFWNLMVPRTLATLNPQKFNWQKERSEQLTKTDNGFFYHRFMLEEKK
ncbi:MAG: DUF3419 family protein, partial [Bacteroidia bacterium]